VITGATKVEHVLSNVDAADWALTAEESEEVSAILKGSSPDSPRKSLLHPVICRATLNKET
jgi:aryl-alcohol dehydrogenase-like predicted oxidoreductase